MTEGMYTEEFITIPQVEEEEEEQQEEVEVKEQNFQTPKSNHGFKVVEDSEETDPRKPVGAVVYEGKGFEKTSETLPPKKPNLDIMEEPGEEKVTPTATQEVFEAPQVKTMKVPGVFPERIKPRKKKKVTFSGPFGEISTGYLDVYIHGMYLILVEEDDVEFSYTPPESDAVLTVRLWENNKELQVISPGIHFPMVNQKVTVTVLLKVRDQTGEQDE